MLQVEDQVNPQMSEVSPQEVINLIDCTLTYTGRMKKGGHSNIYFVKRVGTQYALKLNLTHERFEMDRTFTLENEHRVIEKMKNVEGVINSIRFYDNSPSYQAARSYLYNGNKKNLRKGKNAILLEYVNGPTLTSAEYPLRKEFFEEVNEIREEMQNRGYTTPIIDFNPDNVMVKKDERNCDRPVIIDLMCAVPLHKNSDTRERQIILSDEVYANRIIRRYFL